MAISVEQQTTVYVRNLNERASIPDLIATLNFIFSDYGRVLDITAKSSLRRKGQAFVVFDNHDSARRSIEELNGFDIFEMPMDLQFARQQSDAVVAAQGGQQALEEWQRRRKEDKERKATLEATAPGLPSKLKRPAPASTAEALAGPRPAKISKPAGPLSGPGLRPTGPAASGAAVPDEYLPPNKILFVQNIPDDVSKDMLEEMFAAFDGFKEVRSVPGRKNIAFVEYREESAAVAAKNALQGSQVGQEQRLLKVTYQRQ